MISRPSLDTSLVLPVCFCFGAARRHDGGGLSRSGALLTILPSGGLALHNTLRCRPSSLDRAHPPSRTQPDMRNRTRCVPGFLYLMASACPMSSTAGRLSVRRQRDTSFSCLLRGSSAAIVTRCDPFATIGALEAMSVLPTAGRAQSR